jgi:hypothetical protein
LASRIKEAFGIELALRTVFELPTIAGLSGHIQAMCCASVGNSGDADANHNQTEEIIL